MMKADRAKLENLAYAIDEHLSREGVHAEVEIVDSRRIVIEFPEEAGV